MDAPFPLPERRWWLTALFLLVSVGFVGYRHASFVVYNDSIVTYASFSSRTEAARFFEAHQAAFVADPAGVFAQILHRAFGSVHGSGYRPLEEVYICLGALLLYNPDGPDWLYLAFVGAVHGVLFLVVFFTARRFVKRDLTAVAAALFFLGTPAFAATAWVYMVGLQGFVPLLVCSALLCYWNSCSSRYAPLYLGGLAAVLLLGPWYREFLMMVPILIGFLELQRGWALRDGGRAWRGRVGVLALAALGLAHALYPTFLIHFTAGYDLPVQPVFRLGASLSTSLGHPAIRWFAVWHFLPQFPPLLLVLAGLGALAALVRRGRPLDARRVRELVFLTFWFLLMFLPILRVFTEHIHFLYATVPAAVILAVAVEALWDRLAPAAGRWAWVRPGLAALLLFLAVDQAQNLVGAYRVNHCTYAGIQKVADWFRQHVPEDSLVVSNAVHAQEIRWHAGYHFQSYHTIPAGAYGPEWVVDEPHKLLALIRNRARRKVYFLDVDFDYLPDKERTYRHKYVHFSKMPLRDLGVVHTTRCRYLCLDPLRRWIPRQYVPFLGGPDLVNQFYCGPARRHPAFLCEVAALYHLYEVRVEDLDLPSAAPGAETGAGLQQTAAPATRAE